jgi:hypothetical protein
MNVDLVVLLILNLLTSNSLIQLSPDFNWTPQIIVRINSPVTQRDRVCQ